MSAKIISDDTLTIFHDGTVATAHNSDPLWDEVKEALINDDYDTAMQLLDKPAVISEFIKGSDLTIEGYTIWYKGKELPSALARRILRMREEGFDVTPMVRFVERLYQNPSNRAITELYGFLSCNDLPITEDGFFLAYKRIRENWKDCHSGTIDNSIGEIVEMERQDVDDDCNRTCSHGLHFASLNYLTHFGGSKLVALKISPADVVSIPIDYDNSKGRCCRYQVIEELPMELVAQQVDYWKTAVVSLEDDFANVRARLEEGVDDDMKFYNPEDFPI